MLSKEDNGTPPNGRRDIMRKRNRWFAGGVFLLAAALTVTMTCQAQPPKRPTFGASLSGQIAAATKLEETDVAKVLKELGPAISARIANGEQVQMPGLGRFRVVRIPEHRDLVDGRPAVIPASNYVEFLPEQGIVNASNAQGAVPAVTVPPFEYHPLKDQTPSQRVPESKVPSTRIR
jgi:nucleoid DNA-binding protein